jgi:hypothetical protein
MLGVAAALDRGATGTGIIQYLLDFKKTHGKVWYTQIGPT